MTLPHWSWKLRIEMRLARKRWLPEIEILLERSTGGTASVTFPIWLLNKGITLGCCRAIPNRDHSWILILKPFIFIYCLVQSIVVNSFLILIQLKKSKVRKIKKNLAKFLYWNCILLKEISPEDEFHWEAIIASFSRGRGPPRKNVFQSI